MSTSSEGSQDGSKEGEPRNKKREREECTERIDVLPAIPDLVPPSGVIDAGALPTASPIHIDDCSTSDETSLACAICACCETTIIRERGTQNLCQICWEEYCDTCVGSRTHEFNEAVSACNVCLTELLERNAKLGGKILSLTKMTRAARNAFPEERSIHAIHSAAFDLHVSW